MRFWRLKRLSVSIRSGPEVTRRPVRGGVVRPTFRYRTASIRVYNGPGCRVSRRGTLCIPVAQLFYGTQDTWQDTTPATTDGTRYVFVRRSGRAPGQKTQMRTVAAQTPRTPVATAVQRVKRRRQAGPSSEDAPSGCFTVTLRLRISRALAAALKSDQVAKLTTAVAGVAVGFSDWAFPFVFERGDLPASPRREHRAQNEAAHWAYVGSRPAVSLAFRAHRSG